MHTRSMYVNAAIICIICLVCICHVPAIGADGTAKRVIIIIGTEDSGADSIHSMLSAAGVWMHPNTTDGQLDSRSFVEHVQKLPEFGNSSFGLLWETRNNSANYNVRKIPNDLRRKLVTAHQQMATELLSGVPADVEVWGFKATRAIHVLPFLAQVFRNLHVIHHVRDGRDVACTAITSNEPDVSIIAAGQGCLHRPSSAAAAAWAQINLNAQEWATFNGLAVKGQYSITRLEDFLDASADAAVRTMLANAQIPFDDTTVRKAAAAIKLNVTCPVGHWKVALNSTDKDVADEMRSIDAQIHGALQSFNYEPATPLAFPSWLEAPEEMARWRETALKAATSNEGLRPIIMTEVSYGYEHLLENWLAWLEGTGVDLSRVIIVVKKKSAETVLRIVEGKGTSVFVKPMLLPDFAADLERAAETGNGTRANGGAADPRRFAQYASVLLARNRLLHEALSAGIPVLMSDVDAIWLKDALQHIQELNNQQGGYDIIFSKGGSPALAHTLMGFSGNAGLAFYSPTNKTRTLMRQVLHNIVQKLPTISHRRQHLSDQLAFHNEILKALDVRAANGSESACQNNVEECFKEGRKATTAQNPLRLLFLPHRQFQRNCDPAFRHAAIVMHCVPHRAGNVLGKTPGKKKETMCNMGLWKVDSAAAPGHSMGGCDSSNSSVPQ